MALFSLCGLHAIRANWFENERELAVVVARFTVNSEARDKSLIGTVSEKLLTVDGQEDAVLLSSCQRVWLDLAPR